MGRYNLYRGVGSLAEVDFSAPVAVINSGQTTRAITGLGHAQGQEYTYALRAVGNGGVEEPGVLCTCRVLVSGTDVIGQRPNAPTFAVAKAMAGARVQVEFTYESRGQLSAPVGCQVAIITDQVPDGFIALEVIPIAASCRRTKLLAEEFEDGQTVQLACRALSATGVVSAWCRFNPVVVDSSAPAELSWISAVQQGGN